MWKKARLFCVVAMILMLTVVGCSPAAPEGEEGSAGGGSSSLKMAVGAHGGGWYIAGAALESLWEKHLDNTVIGLVPGGGFANPTRVNNHQEDIGFTFITNAVGAKEGLEPYEGKADDLTGMINLNIKQYFHLAILKDRKVDTFDKLIGDEVGLKISVGPRGSGGEATTGLVLREYGVEYDDFKKWGGSVEFDSPGDSVDKIRDGHLDTYAVLTTSGDPTTMDLAVSRDVVFLPVDDHIQDAMVSKYGYSKDNIPAGTYQGQDAAVPTVADSVLLVANKDVSEEVIYNLVKALCENAEELQQMHAIFKDFDPAVAPDMPIPIHPGAQKYFEEEGLL